MVVMANLMNKVGMKKFPKVAIITGLFRLFIFILLVVYVVVGAIVFVQIESVVDDENFQKKREAGAQVNEALQYIIDSRWDDTSDRSEFQFKTKQLMTLYKNFVVHQASSIGYDATNETEWEKDWTFPNSLLFTVTTVAAVGYGHIFPTTTKGQLVCLLYGLIGVPYLLLFLAIIGDFLGDLFTVIYSRLCCRWCRLTRFISKKKRLPERRSEVWSEATGAEEYMPTDLVVVPITVIMTILTLYLLFGGALFSFWEGWTLMESTYFCFVTLTTIGFGDYVPGSTTGGDSRAIQILIMTSLYCMIGMALITMCINLMQEQIVAKVDNLLQNIGYRAGRSERYLENMPTPKKTPSWKMMVTPQSDTKISEKGLLQDID